MKHNSSFFILVSFLCLTFFVGCGTVSKIESAGSDIPFDVSQYSSVTVLDFENSAPTKHAEREKIDEHNEKVEIAGRLFADKIAAELRLRNLFTDITRGPVEGNSLVIYGKITRYEEGSAAARLFIGLGAGSSYFDASVQFKDNLQESDLAVLKVDKNSWVLGGGLAAGQTVEGYMNEATKKIADQLEEKLMELKNPSTGG